MGRSEHGAMTTAKVAIAVLLGMSVLADPGPNQKASAENLQDAKYVGLTKCAACHFPQYKNWKTSPHGKAFEILPTKYKKDPSCLKCHTTGFGLPSTVKDPAAAYLTGVNCEACHGQGSEHASIALAFIEEPLTEDGLAQLRRAIKKINPVNVCIQCHVAMAHKEHPKFDREPAKPGTLPSPRSQNFFKIHE